MAHLLGELCSSTRTGPARICCLCTFTDSGAARLFQSKCVCAGDLEPSSTAQGKKKKKAGKSAVTSLGTDDIDALLTELDGPQSLAPLEPAQEQDTSAADGAAQLVPGWACGPR